MANDEQVLENELMPNSGEIAAPGIFIDDEEQSQVAPDEERQEESIMAVSEPIIADLLEWFDEQIAKTDSVAKVQEAMDGYKLTADQALAAHDIVRILLEAGKDDLQSRYDAFIKKREADNGEEA